MTTIQKALAGIRELRNEELDLVGGAYSVESTLGLTSSARTFCHQNGCVEVHIPDDQIVDVYID